MGHTSEQARRIASKFNGRIVMDITGLKNGPELTEFMATLKRYDGSLTDLYIFMKSPEEIRDAIRAAFSIRTHMHVDQTPLIVDYHGHAELVPRIYPI